MSKLYVSPPSEKLPVRAAYMPPFRSHGMAGNRLLPRTVCKEDKTQPWTVGFHTVHYTCKYTNVKQNQKCGSPSPGLQAYVSAHMFAGHKSSFHRPFTGSSQKLSTLSTGFSTGQAVEKPDFSRLFRETVKKSPQPFEQLWRSLVNRTRTFPLLHIQQPGGVRFGPM